MVDFPVRAEPPTVEHIYPAGFPLDSTNELAVAGKLEPWPPRIWVSCPGVDVTTETNKGRCDVVVSATAPVGAHLIRFFNQDGSSAPRIFVISTEKPLLESERNDQLSRAQHVATLPATINGRLNKTGDVDSFAFTLCAGQWLDAQVDAYTIGSKTDALLRLVTPDGVQQAWNHDFTSLDPRLLWQAPVTGTYILQLMAFKYPADSEVRFTGGDGCVYRLHLASLARAPELITGGAPEHEPNDTPAVAPVVSLPATIRGAIDRPGDEDCFGFDLDKDQTVELSLASASLGSRLDGWIKVVDAGGKELARTTELSRFRDPRVEWKAQTNGAFYASVGNLEHAGGHGCEYRLSIRTLSPDWSANCPSSSITLAAGETNDVKFTVTRLRGFTPKLTASFEELPKGLHAEPVELSAQAGETTLKLIAEADATPTQGPVRIVISEADGLDRARPVLFSLISASEDNGVPGGYMKLLVDSTDQLWLTVKPKALGKDPKP